MIAVVLAMEGLREVAQLDGRPLPRLSNPSNDSSIGRRESPNLRWNLLLLRVQLALGRPFCRAKSCFGVRPCSAASLAGIAGLPSDPSSRRRKQNSVYSEIVEHMPSTSVFSGGALAPSSE